MGKYYYSRKIHTPAGEETFAVEQMNSFDEAKRIVDKVRPATAVKRGVSNRRHYGL